MSVAEAENFTVRSRGGQITASLRGATVAVRARYAFTLNQGGPHEVILENAPGEFAVEAEISWPLPKEDADRIWAALFAEAA